MASSSDESFAWTDASNSSESSIENQKMTKHNGTVNGLNDDSDSETSYKKKLHKKLLINNDGNDTTQEPVREKKVKRKRMDDNSIDSLKTKKIKLEPSSDADTPKKKKKKSLNNSQSNETYDESHEDMSQDHSNLNTTVKQEPGLESPSHKSNKRRKSEVNISTHSNNDLNETSMITENYDENCTADNNGSCSSKKKKKKSKKERSSQIDDNDVSAEVKINKDTDSEQVEDSKHSIVKNEAVMPKSEVPSVDDNSTDNKSELSDEDDPSNLSNTKIKSNKSITSINRPPEKHNKRVSFISDRIKYEDVDHSQMDHSINNEVEKTNSRKLNKFLKINETLKPVSTRQQGDWVVSPDDEVWAIKCPHNIDTNAFLGVNIKLDKKCKIKIEGQTYEGTMNNETDSITVLTLQNSNYIIKKLPLNGTLQLRKRIPKVHILENNDNQPDNQLDFVPLPVTKKRHPLFGSDYKKAMKVPSAIAQRLKDPYSDTTCENDSKKSKKKKHKSKLMDIDNTQLEESQEIVPENDETPVKIKKKNRKRKHEADSEHTNTKRAKHADSTAVWESEQAIEENLFNF